MADDNGQKTEKPTPKRLQEARRQGQIPRSPDLTGWLVVLVATWLLPALVGRLGRELRTYVMEMTAAVAAHETEAFMMGTGRLIPRLVVAMAPYLALVMVITAVSLAAQGGVTLTGEAMKPKLERLSLRQGVKRLVSTQSAVDTVKAVVRLAVLVALVANTSRGLIAEYLNGTTRDLSAVGPSLAASLLLLMRAAAFAGVVVGLADYVYQRHKISKRLKMSKEEIKQEARSTEGDPMIKSRRRAIHARLSRNQMLAAVSDASVVVVNPTHVAVALAYAPGRVPTVVAKGGDLLAERIRERAFESGVPVVEARPLARVLFDTLDVGSEIPAAMYEAVAIVIAFVMRTPRNRFGRSIRRVNVPASKVPVGTVPVGTVPVGTVPVGTAPVGTVPADGAPTELVA
ncbi:MAG: EscU/YscU/HrcU family type III secretion system export apparatus switch protein [Acidimicrobiales bacterium]